MLDKSKKHDSISKKKKKKFVLIKDYYLHLENTTAIRT